MEKYSIRLSETALKEYNKWKSTDKKTYDRINLIFKNMQDNPFTGIGKPEPLKYDLSGFWSRRIDDKNRIIYEVKQERYKKYSKDN